MVPANIPANVSGKIKDRIPDLPITVLATAEAKLEPGRRGATEWKPVVRKADRERWNDWGIGLLLQGDLKGAEYAFQRVTEAEPEYADGWLNVARALIQEGETEAAKPYIDKGDGHQSFAGANPLLQVAGPEGGWRLRRGHRSTPDGHEKYPRDRVVLNQMGRVQFLKREYRECRALLRKRCCWWIPKTCRRTTT